MKVVISRQECQDKLSDIQSVVEKKSTMPILSHFLLTAANGGSSITATDLETAIREPIDLKVEDEGRLCIPARKLFEIVREMEGDIRIESEDSQWIRVRSGATSFRLACLPSEDYPLWPDMGASEQIELPSGKLSAMIEKTIYSAGESDTRYTLNGILFNIKDGALTVVGTDGHRMAVISMPIEGGPAEEKKLIVQRKAASELNKFLSGADKVKLYLGKNHVLFQVGDVEFLTRLIEGSYPNYTQVIPSGHDKKLSLDKEAFSKALRRVSIMSRERSNAVKADLENNLMTLSSSNPDLGEARDELTIEYAAEPLSLGFNAKYLLDALGAMDTAKVSFELHDPLSPTMLRPEGGPEGFDYKCVIMPMRI